MIRYKYSKGPIETKVLTIAALALVWCMVIVWMHYPDAVEQWYSEGLYVGVYHVLHLIFNLFPFSIGDVAYIILIIYLLYALVKIIWLLIKKRFKQTLIYLLKLVIGFQLIVLTFYLFWGMNYFRPSAAKRLALQDTSYTFNDIKTVTSALIDSTNACRNRLTKADLQQGNTAVYQTAVNAINTLASHSNSFPAYRPQIKASLLTFFMNYLGTEGYYNPFTSESQINYQMPVYLKPFTACHEMGHQMGFGAEDEANFVGFISGANAQDHLLRYSSYYAGMEEFMYAVARTDTVVFKQLKLKISPQVHQDLLAERVYWKSFESKAGIFSSILYDNYLKTNNQPQGLKTYNRMIRLVMAWYRKGEIIK